MSVIAFVQSKNNDGILIAKDGILVAKEEKANLKLKIEEKFNMFKKRKIDHSLLSIKMKIFFLVIIKL